VRRSLVIFVEVCRYFVVVSLLVYNLPTTHSIGTDLSTVAPTVRKLESLGVGSILDYAAETDLASEKKSSNTLQKVVVLLLYCFKAWHCFKTMLFL
jgi:hypothetical protein